MTGRPGPSGPILGLAGPRAEKTVSLALQGGGAHGAFTWGVLDRLIEDGRLAFEAITGASAGSMNAVVMADGWQDGGPDGARTKLETFWRKVSLDGNLEDPQRRIFDRVIAFWSIAGGVQNPWLNLWNGAISPYLANPLDINPLRKVLEELVDFERLRSAEVKLFVAATSVWTGKIRVFETPELAADHVMASACLPTLFRAVEIDGEPFWDGGYSGNPPLFPIFYAAHCDDLLLVQINPIERRQTPQTAAEIQNRLTEINFNAGLLRELRVIDFVTRLIDEGKLSQNEYKRVLMHRIDGDGFLDWFAASSRLNPDWDMFLRLRDLGREAASGWLERGYESIGRESTLDLRAAYS
ncbi:patatin-like phospholipase family protein [Enterovirga aerilata]|uniref:Patatin-like phospholipase family protein n=1 Tax=Enterovirga aerilata TaxID=2730920 RepID=A0A849IKK4_9HYPH|nr:patatin-like phospholipase family protein [Enterovirga sp. DB1703]NNM74473.1 patatin-like phospholipase family protein [Enterovirga sp. DB1703]